MKRGLAIVTMAAIIGSSVPVVLASAATVANTATPASVWTVRSGDTLWKISQSTGVPVVLIEQYNSSFAPSGSQSRLDGTGQTGEKMLNSLFYFHQFFRNGAVNGLG